MNAVDREDQLTEVQRRLADCEETVAKDSQDATHLNAEMRQTAERFRELTAHIQQVLWMIDAKESKLLYVSPAYARMWGRSCQSFLDNSHSYMEGIHPLDQEMMIREDATMYQTGHIDVECRVLRPNGTVRWAWIRGYPVREQGQIVRLVGVIEDITKRKATEQALHASQARNAAVLRASPDAIVIMDHESKVVDFNPAAESIFGYSHAEAVGKDMSELIIPPHMRDRHKQGLARYLATGVGPILNERLEMPACRADGTEFSCELTITPIGGEGKPLFTGFIRDITERKRAEEQNATLAAIIEYADDAIVSLTLNGIVISWNHGAERLYGYSAEEMIGRPIILLHPPEKYEEYHSIMARAKRGDRVAAFDTVRRRKDGMSIPVSLSASAIEVQSGHVTGTTKISHDISKIKRLEEQFRQAQKMEAVGTLAGGVAHDFNNLLTVINGYSEILISRLGPDDPMQELLVEIHKAGERAVTLTRQLLAFSRQQILEPKVLDLNAVVTDTENMLRRLIGEDIILTTVLDPALQPVKVDPGQIEQVLMNLAVNARDAMPQGGRLNVETRNVILDEAYRQTRPAVRPGAYSMLAVTDAGTGMDEATKARIFEPFFTTKVSGKGTGLGLAVVHGVVNQSGGHIEVESELGRGTAFKVYFPQVKEALTSPKLGAGTRTMPTATETLLLVEDDDAVRAIAGHVLRSCGYTLLEANDGREAIRVAREHDGPIHLVVSDVVMPHLGGRLMAEGLEGVRPGLKMLFMSGYTDDAVIRHGILGDEVAFLQKPFTPTALAQKVREVLDGKG
jgi:two-component system, cell cycle sensor histidine kinase and response regulator CckA